MCHMCEWKQKERQAEMVNERERETGGKTLYMPANQDYSSGLFGNPLLTCAALTFISIFLRASDQADLFIWKIC